MRSSSLTAVTILTVLAAIAHCTAGCSSRKVVARKPVPGQPSAEVTFVREDCPVSCRSYAVEFPNGAVTKQWLNGHQTTDEAIRRECRIEYDGKTPKVIGPGNEVMSIPGYTFGDGKGRAD
jgi:hypothetical protein